MCQDGNENRFKKSLTEWVEISYQENMKTLSEKENCKYPGILQTDTPLQVEINSFLLDGIHLK